MAARTIATVVTAGNNNIKIPVPNIPMPLVEENEMASTVQVKMASAATIEVRQWQVQQTSLPTWRALAAQLPWLQRMDP
jgi:hypothetical protein